MASPLSVMGSIFAASLAIVFLNLLENLIWKPARLRKKLRMQGIHGPPPSFLLGNILEMRNNHHRHAEQLPVNHTYVSSLFPFFEKWRNTYGETFMFSMGNIQMLFVSNPHMVREIATSTSLHLGKPSYQRRILGALLGEGVLTSNGESWLHQRRILAPELYMERVKDMMKMMTETAMEVVDSWRAIVKADGEEAEVEIDGFMRTFSGDVISKACFGSNYSEGENIFLKLRELQDIMSRQFFFWQTALLRNVPTKSNRQAWKLEREVKEMILEIARERMGAPYQQKDLLQMILDASDSEDSLQAKEKFVVDNCKNVYLAGYETTAVSATWTLMLLASHPSWQERLRVEVAETTGGKSPDGNSIRKMKYLAMVINESLRLYPPAPIISREALSGMPLGSLYLPKGVNLWIPVASLHLDPELWGPRAHEFRPERFANGVAGASKNFGLYMPFGVGPRTCMGQHFALAELKILLATVVSNFSFTLSPRYKHAPTSRLVTQPEHGVHLLIKKI